MGIFRFAKLAKAASSITLALALVAVQLPSSTAWAGTPAQDLDAAETAYADLDYPQANKLALSLSQQHNLTHDQLVRTFRLLARTHAVLDHGQPASEAFKLLLAYNPDEKNEASLPPKVQEAFSTARGFWAGYTTRPGLEVQAQVQAKDGGALRVTTRDPIHLVKKVAVGFRWGPTGNFTTSNIAIADGVTVDIPPAPPTVTRLDYYAQALDDHDNAVFDAGSPGTPKTLLAEAGGGGGGGGEGGGRSILASPWFWIITGVIVAGGVTTAVVVTSGKKQDVTLPPTAANFIPSLFCGGSKCQ